LVSEAAKEFYDKAHMHAAIASIDLRGVLYSKGVRSATTFKTKVAAICKENELAAHQNLGGSLCRYLPRHRSYRIHSRPGRGGARCQVSLWAKNAQTTEKEISKSVPTGSS
jgi:hypothetical protein